MAVLLFFLAIILAMILVAAPVVFLQARRTFRDQKNYERGLKIVPLMIHLPPPSDDTEIGNRDVRDVTDETISKAELIYNIIASTYQKGIKRNFFGQRHFAFEIVGTQGFVYFYAAVPVVLLEVIKQAINSAYPTARLEEVSEHNIFSPVGRVSGTLGGELTLKEPYAYPIATYQDLKRDSMQSLLNALSSLGKEDGAGIQILMRPANPGWRKTAQNVAGKKRKGQNGFDLGNLGGLIHDIGVALVKPPEGDRDGGPKKPDLSNLEQSTLDAIDEKTRHPGFEVVIRVIASSNVSQRAQDVLNNVVASFALYDAPGKNGFKYTPAKDIDGLITSYIMRFFPTQHSKSVLNSVELATLFHFPDENNIPTSQLTRQSAKQVDGPRNIPEEGLLLGYNLFRGTRKPIRLANGDRQRHMYVVGQTGTGKSTFLENLALQDMLSGNGFAFVDPHGDEAERLLSMVPKERTEDVIYFSPADMDHPMGLNLFEFNSVDQKDFLIQEALNMLYKLYDPQHQGIMGPRYEHLFRNAALTIMADPQGGTFVDIPKLFRDQKFVQQKLQHVKDMNVREFWLKEMPASSRSNDFGEVTSWFVSKFGAFLSNEMMRNIIGQTKSAFDLRDIMDNKKILLVNLSKGRTGELNSKLLGMVFVMKFQAAAMSRSDVPEDQRVDFSLYVDEFQNFSTDSFATIMSEARKYHLNLIVANQFTTQLTTEIRDAVFGNMGTIVSFRIGQNDVEALSQYFQPTFSGDDLLRIPNFNTIVRTLIGGVPTQPFSMTTLPALGTPNPRLSAALKQLSAAKYGRPKAIIEKEINERMATKGEALGGGTGAGSMMTPAFGQGPPAAGRLGGGLSGSSAAASRSPAPAAAGGTSFLDDWLNKRPTNTPNGAATGPAINKHPADAMLPPEASSPTSAIVSDSPNGHTISRSAKPDKTQSTSTSSQSSQNISSDQIEQSEVHEIADELKQELKSASNKTENSGNSLTSDKSDAKSAAIKAKPKAPTEHTFDLTPGKDDTIIIDREGIFHQTPQDHPAG
ncbi:MAG TPA: ATP-binding protein [Candidatus Saccharimonadales bacterium]|nr:ATP-binding protein [Candidatus Saccharimonadales bacterium]